MIKSAKKSRSAAGVLFCAFTLAACSGLSTVDKDGTATQLAWPDAQNATFNTGSWPLVRNLRQVAPGATKDQLYGLLGRPHFNEGLVGVREWDYLFHFQTPSGTLTCQYKVLFDKDMRARNFHWNPEQCRDVVSGSTSP